jgi:hypothetical protein
MAQSIVEKAVPAASDDAELVCPLLGVKRTSGGSASMSAFDPKRT